MVHIHYTIHNCKRTKNKLRHNFQGACIDTGAHCSVVGYRQIQAYCREHNRKLVTKPSTTSFKFGDGSYQSCGKMKVRIPTPKGEFMYVQFDIIHADVPMLVGLDALDKEKMYANNVTDELVNTKHDWAMNLTRKFGHLFLVWYSSNTNFTKAELTKLHRHFHQPSPSKLLALIKRSKLSDADAETKTLLQEILDSCDACKQCLITPEHFKVSLPPDKIIFNKELAMDVMWLGNKAVLHVIDTDTHFNSASILKGHSVEDVWKSFLSCWVTLYQGYPDTIHTDQGSAFTSVRFQRLFETVGTKLQLSGVESNNSIGSGERYHEPLRRVFNKILSESPNPQGIGSKTRLESD